MARCDTLRGEFKRYRWKKDTGRSESEPREQPVKKKDHALDALRYVVMAKPMVVRGEQGAPGDTYKDRILRHSLRRLRARGGGTADSGFGPGQWA